MTVRVLTDSTSDLPEAVAAEHNIVVLPAYINIGDESYLDQVELSRAEFYKRLPSLETPPTTAVPAVGTFTLAYEQMADEGATEILSIHISSTLSSMLNAARLGAQAIDRVSVQLFDSRQLSMGLGLLALTAAKDAAAGKTMDEIVASLEARVRKTHVFAMLDTLEFLRRSGRVSWTEFGLGTLLRVKPLLHVYDGEVHPLERVRTHRRAVQHLIQQVGELGGLEQITLLHTANLEGAEMLRTQARHLFPDGVEPLAVEVTPTIGSHVGPGALGFALIRQG